MSNIRKHIDRVNRYVVDELVAETARNRYRQADVAAHLGISQGAVSERFRHKVALSTGEFVAWCELVNQDPVRVLDVALRRLGDASRQFGDEDPAVSPAFDSIRASDYFGLVYPKVVPPSRDDLDLAANAGHALPPGTVTPEQEDLPAAAHPLPKGKRRKGMESDHDGA